MNLTKRYCGLFVLLLYSQNLNQCKAVAAAIFGPSYGNRLSLVPVTADNQFSLLNSGVVDMLASHVLFTMENMVSEVRRGFEGGGGAFVCASVGASACISEQFTFSLDHFRPIHPKNLTHFVNRTQSRFLPFSLFSTANHWQAICLVRSVPA